MYAPTQMPTTANKPITIPAMAPPDMGISPEINLRVGFWVGWLEGCDEG